MDRRLLPGAACNLGRSFLDASGNSNAPFVPRKFRFYFLSVPRWGPPGPHEIPGQQFLKGLMATHQFEKAAPRPTGDSAPPAPYLFADRGRW